MIPLSQPSIKHRERALVEQAMQASWISGTGPFVKQFEDTLAAKLHGGHAVAVTNGTVALELALKALGIGAGDEVIVPALTFVAPAAAVRSVGATPVLVDVDAETWTIDPLVTPKAITAKTRAIIAVDAMGHPCDFAALDTMMRFTPFRQPIEIIEDAAQAHGALYRRDTNEEPRPAGTLALISTFSFHANKAISLGEGGAVLTPYKPLADYVRLIANHGMTPGHPYWHEVVGTNNRMTNLQAAIGVAQVERWDALTACRRTIAKLYDERLQPLFDAGIMTRRPVAKWAKESCWLYTVASPYRQQFLDGLHAQDIDARAIWYPVPDLPPYKKEGGFPVTRKVGQEAFMLPTWADMTIDCIDMICEVLHGVSETLKPVPTT